MTGRGLKDYGANCVEFTRAFLAAAEDAGRAEAGAGENAGRRHSSVTPSATLN